MGLKYYFLLRLFFLDSNNLFRPSSGIVIAAYKEKSPVLCR